MRAGCNCHRTSAKSRLSIRPVPHVCPLLAVCARRACVVPWSGLSPRGRRTNCPYRARGCGPSCFRSFYLEEAIPHHQLTDFLGLFLRHFGPEVVKDLECEPQPFPFVWVQWFSRRPHHLGDPTYGWTT